MGRLFLEELPGPALFCCKSCELPISTPGRLLVTITLGLQARPYLFDSVVNVVHVPNQDIVHPMGIHKTNEIYCRRCLQLLGRCHVKVAFMIPKYMEGKYVIDPHRLKRIQDVV